MRGLQEYSKKYRFLQRLYETALFYDKAINANSLQMTRRVLKETKYIGNFVYEHFSNPYVIRKLDRLLRRVSFALTSYTRDGYLTMKLVKLSYPRQWVVTTYTMRHKDADLTTFERGGHYLESTLDFFKQFEKETLNENTTSIIINELRVHGLRDLFGCIRILSHEEFAIREFRDYLKQFGLQLTWKSKAFQGTFVEIIYTYGMLKQTSNKTLIRQQDLSVYSHNYDLDFSHRGDPHHPHVRL